MSPTFELVLNQARSLTVYERQKLARILVDMPSSERQGTDERVAKIRAFRGKFRNILPSSEEFMAQKRAEVLIEDR